MKNNLNKLIFVCQVFYPDKTSTSQLFSSLMLQLKKQGLEIYILCGYPSITKINNLSKTESYYGLNIRRCGLNIPTKKNIFFRGITYFTFLFEVFIQLLISKENEKFFGVTNPPFLPWVMGLASKLKKKKYSFYFLDLYPEGLVSLGTIKNDSILVKIWRKINYYSYKQADNLLVLGRDMSNVLSIKYKLTPNKIIYMPLWSSIEKNKIIKFENSQYVKKLKIYKKFVVQYSGNMGLWHDINIFVNAAKLLENESIIQFVFFGDGLKYKEAKLLSQKLECKNVIWHDFVPIKQLDESLASCHISLISLKSGLEGVAVPCKLYGILASGRAIVAQVPAESEVALTIKEHDCGIVVQPGDLYELSEQIKFLSKNKKIVSSMGKNAFNAYKKFYRLSNATHNFKKIINI